MEKRTHSEASMDHSNSGSGENAEISGNSSPLTLDERVKAMEERVKAMDERFDNILAEEIWSDDTDIQAAATTGLLDFICSVECKCRMDEVVEAGVLPRLAKFLEIHDHPKLQTAAASIFSDIACGVYAQNVVDQVAMSSFVTVLNSDNQDARSKVIFALGRISLKYRDHVLFGGALSPLLALVGNTSGAMQHNAMWTLCELCRVPLTEFDVITPTLPILLQLIHSSDEVTVYYACVALYHFLEGDTYHGKWYTVQTMINAGICPQLVQLVSHTSNHVVVAALRTMGQIADIDDMQTQVLMDTEGLLGCLFLLLHPSNRVRGNICKEVCKVVSNFTSGTRRQIRTIIDSGIMCRLVYHLKHSDIGIQTEAALAISRTTERASNNHIRYLSKKSWIGVYCERLRSTEEEILIGCLNVLTQILELGKEESFLGEDWDNAYAKDVQECGGLVKIQTLLTHGNAEVRRMSVAIIEDFFTED